MGGVAGRKESRDGRGRGREGVAEWGLIYEYVLACSQKFLPDITLPPLYGVSRVQGGKEVMKQV